MKIQLVVLFCSVCALTASPVYSQEGKLDISYSKTSLISVLNDLKERTGYQFVYFEGVVPESVSVSVSRRNSTIEEILDEILNKNGFNYTITNNVVVIKCNESTQQPQSRVVSGHVRDSQGAALVGATVIVKGSSRGTATDAAGEFSLAVEGGNATLLFSYIGKQTVEIAYTGQATLNVVMLDKVNTIGEVMVTGYQTLSGERSTGSFATVKGDAIAEKASLRGNILESIEGLSTGLAINMGEGEDKFTIRGITSINATKEPLYVVDGVPISAKNLELMVNSNDIASVTLLKDATAASIWGAQAANGVVVIVTKKGTNTGKKLNISYDGSFTYKGMPDYDYLDYMSSEMFVKNALEVFDPSVYSWGDVTTGPIGATSSGYYPILMPHERSMYLAANKTITDAERDRQLQELASLNNRKQIEDYLMSQSLFTRHSVSFSGGSEHYSVYGSTAYEYNQDNYRSKNNKYLVNVRQDFQLTPWLSLDLTTNLSYTKDSNGLKLRFPNSTIDYNSLLPYMMLKDKDGNNLSYADLIMYDEYRLDAEEQSGLSLDYVPLDDINNGFDRASSFGVRLNAGIKVRLMEGLEYEGRFQHQSNSGESEVYYDQYSFTTREEVAQFTEPGSGGSLPKYYLPTTGGKYTNVNSRERNWLFRNQFSFDRVFGASHFTALLGMEVQSNRTKSKTANLRGYDPQSLTYTKYDELMLTSSYVFGVLPTTPFGASRLTGSMVAPAENDYRFVSVYANGAYTYLQKYSVNASIRVDQSNLFGSNTRNQFKPVWSAGLAWNIGRESFLAAADFLNRLNLRLSYGLGGNSPDPNSGAGTYDLIMASNSSSFAGLGTGYTMLSPANKELRWERTHTVNFGVDFAFFGSRLSGSIDIYNKKTTDMLSYSDLDSSTGWAQAMMNIGEMSNKGFELTLNSVNVSTSNFHWQTSLNISNNKNKVEKLYLDSPLTGSNIIYQRFIEGYSARSIFAYSWAGLDKLGDPQVFDVDENGNEVKIKKTGDLSGPGAAKYMGTSQPKWFGGLTNSFRYKDFELSFMFVFNFGHKMRNDINRLYTNRLTTNLHKDFDKRWREDGDELTTDVPSYVANSSTSSSRRSMYLYSFADINVVSGSYVKLRDLTLAYTLPRRVCEKLHTESIRIRLQASNLFYIAANKEGVDPEANNYFGVAMSDNTNFTYGGTRVLRYGPSWSASVSVNF